MPGKFRPYVAVALVLALMGCESEERIGGSVVETPTPHVSTATDPEAAICEGDYKQAWKLAADGLSTDHSNPRLAILAAYASEHVGHLIQAQNVYRQLVASDDSTRVSLICKETTVFDGKVSEVAQLRQNAVEQTLASLGVLVEHNDVVAKKAPVAKPESTINAKNVAPKTVAKVTPAVNVGKGGWRYLSHLESYKNRKTLDRGWAALKSTHSVELEGLTPHVETADLGPEKGEYLRLGVVFAARKDALVLCRGLKKMSQYCSVLKIK